MRLVGRDGIALVPEDRRTQGLLLRKSVRENLTLSVIRRFSSYGVLHRGGELALVKEMVDFLRIKVGFCGTAGGYPLGGQPAEGGLRQDAAHRGTHTCCSMTRRAGLMSGRRARSFSSCGTWLNKHYAILFYSSDLAELVNVADRVMVLRLRGSVAATLEGDQISEDAILRAALFDEAA
jgi:ribose transport system ATP-binding protein